MKYIFNKKIWLLIMPITAVIYFSCANNTEKKTQTTEGGDAGSCQCSENVSIPFNSNVPGDLPTGLFSTQQNADCFGWWEFITLNWPTQGDFFGQPGSTAPVQWENYITSEELYPSDGAAPRAWAQLREHLNLPKDVLAKDERMKEATLLLSMTSKFDGLPMFLDSMNTEEAQPQFSPAWLGAQNGTNVWYAIHFNQDEYNYIVNNKFYDAYKQHEAVNKGVPIVFPSGAYNGPTGAVEVKSAWLEVTDPDNPKWKTYKLSKAVVEDIKTGTYRYALVALVGLHILQKTTSQPQWVWTTFEHEANAPDMNQTDTTSISYNFYSPNYKPPTVKVTSGCNNIDTTVTFSSLPNQAPPYYLCSGMGPVPIQVKRQFPIDSFAKAANKTLHAYIEKNYAGSIWSHYHLVNVLWSTKNPPPGIPEKPQIQPLHPIAMAPSPKDQPVANTTMETYIQSQTCTGCHRFTQIAPIPGDTNPKFAADYTFSMFNASYPGKKIIQKINKQKK
ncbi:cytochrome c family protein [Chitinophaga pinensis]|uniref:Cytochrome c family protein n=1 Tax=Chitinophaga pinensis TaxID=79329 RepID=A0A5C6LZN2_9BACT|nr:cytochrome c family protein [Chitinophaga pinensis]TWW01149.1 cytochrome c family protein [Chitinophaga pinensis]